MSPELMWIAAAYANPYRWRKRIELARRFCAHIVESGANLIVVETQHGDRPFELADIPGIMHIPTRAKTMAWSKESQINLAGKHLPEGAEYFGWFDMDIEFRRPEWAAAAVHALQLWPIIQPWSEAIDMDPRGLAMEQKGRQVQHSFGYVWRHYGDVLGWGRNPQPMRIITERHKHHNQPPPYGIATAAAPQDTEETRVIEAEPPPPPYAHPGYAWCARVEFLDRIGWLLDRSGLGAGDHQMSLGLIGDIEKGINSSLPPAYRAYVQAWGERAYRACQGHVGYLPGRIEHAHHGSKENRKYGERWDILKRHQFDPITDVHWNRWGILEISDNKPAMLRDFERYLNERAEDGHEFML